MSDGGALRTLAATVAGAACYGFAAGLGHDLLYAARNTVKMPLLLLATATCCALAFRVVALVGGLLLPLRATSRLAFALFRATAALLASLAPIVGFLALAMRATDDGRRGDYDAWLGANLLAVASAGSLALWRQVRAIAAAGRLSPARARTIAAAWLLLALLVGGQGAFWMRPFFGYPATRGIAPPWFLGAAPDLRGARNFFEAVAQALVRAPLPADLRTRIEQLAR